MRKSLLNQLLTIAVVLVGAVTTGWAVPYHVGVTGQLLDADGKPLVFLDDQGKPLNTVELAAKITFYGSQTDTTVLGEDVTTATVLVHAGSVFSVPMTIPPDLLTRDELWYSLAVDSDQNGLDAGDLFEDRFQFASVPFALSAQPVYYFDTHGGYISTSTGTKSSFTGVESPATHMSMAPFTTPPGGVKYNRLSIFVSSVSPDTSFSFGIYDKDGNLVVASGRITATVNIYASYLEVDVPEGTLEPSALYFTGITASQNIALRNILIPSVPLSGLVTITSDNGLIPNSFSVSTIEPNADAVPISITLTDVPQTQTQTLSLHPKYRWIPLKSEGTAPPQ